MDLPKINLTTIILISKVSDCITIKQYRPIINCSCKIIIKILANRLSKVMDSLIEYSQYAFIKDICIFDNIVSARENLKPKAFYLH
jgi:Reverse transcriptase (RNA-dependent DNA polymerase)